MVDFAKLLTAHRAKKQEASQMAEMSYVCAFVPTEDRSEVLLLRKEQPKWQKGRLNGVGGKIEIRDVETSSDPTEVGHGKPYQPQVYAMHREWQEETGLASIFAHWIEVVYLHGKDREGKYWGVHFFTYAKPELMDLKRHITFDRQFNDAGEKFVFVMPWVLGGMTELIIPNLKWLVPLCLNYHHLQLPISIRDIEGEND